MGAWPDLATAASDLRTYLNDNPTDRPIKQKIAIGEVDGYNINYFTFDDRLVAGTLGVTIDFIAAALATPPRTVTLLDPVMGHFTLDPAPAPSQVVRCNYYFQLFLDADITEALNRAMGQVFDTADITTIPIGLGQVVLNFGGYFAFTKASIRWAERKSKQFIVEEEPVVQETLNRANHYKDLAKKYMDEARILRDDYYRRQSRSLAPAAAMFKPRISRIGPVR